MDCHAKKILNVFIAIMSVLFLVVGCGKNSGGNIIPKSNLPIAKQAQIKQALQKINYSQARDFAQRYGKESMPFMVERVMEIYNMGSDYKNPNEYSVASNLIFSLGDSRDSLVLPALNLWATEKKYRVFRPTAVIALGNLGKKEAIMSLWEIWNEEKGYLVKGDDQEPWPFAGYHPSRGYVHAVLSGTGEALYKLGEKIVVGELIEVAELSASRGRSGFTRIIKTLCQITGESFFSESASSVDYWKQWWGANKGSYQ